MLLNKYYWKYTGLSGMYLVSKYVSHRKNRYEKYKSNSNVRNEKHTNIMSIQLKYWAWAQQNPYIL